MQPPIAVSVSRTSPHAWSLGSSIICEGINKEEAAPANAIVDWRDGDSTFYLRQRNATDLVEGDSAIDRIHTGGTSAAVWCLGEDIFCKVHAWYKGLELEANTIRFVQEKAPEVPIPEVIYSWIDHPLGGTFLITKRVRGQTLEWAWPQLSSAQRTQIATDVARFCTLLAANTSSQF